MTIFFRSLFFSLLLVVGASGSGTGISNDPVSFCDADGDRFTCCMPLAVTTALGRPTGAKFETTITCDLERVKKEKHDKTEAMQDFLIMDFTTANNCICQAHFPANTGGSIHDTGRDCACSVCPIGSLQHVSLDCRSMVDENPRTIFGDCAFVDCDGRCNGEGPPVFGNVVPPADDCEELTYCSSRAPPGITSTSTIQESGASSSSSSSSTTIQESTDPSFSAASLVMITIAGGILLILFAALIKASAAENSQKSPNTIDGASLEEGTMASEVSLEE